MENVSKELTNASGEKSLRDPQIPGDTLMKIARFHPPSNPFPHEQSRVDGAPRFDLQGV